MSAPTGEAPPPLRPAPSSWQRVLLVCRRLRFRWRPGALLAAVVLGVVVGFLTGRSSTPDPAVAVARQIEEHVLPLALDADSIWTSGSDERPPVSEGLVALRRDGDPTLVLAGLEEWLRAYDDVLRRLERLELSPAARPVQRQFQTSITLARDAVEVLGHAATIEDPQLRADLKTEVGRLRQRSEQLNQAARASIVDLQGRLADVSPLAPVAGFREES